MPTIETIEKGLPHEVVVVVKVPTWSMDLGRVYWQKKVAKELFIPLVALLEGGADDAKKGKAKLQTEMKELEVAYAEIKRQADLKDEKIAELETKLAAIKDLHNNLVKGLKTV